MIFLVVHENEYFIHENDELVPFNKNKNKISISIAKLTGLSNTIKVYRVASVDVALDLYNSLKK